MSPHDRTVAIMADRSDKFCALLVALLAGFATISLLQPYFIASSDGLYHLYRLMEYDAVLKDGVWYPRWAPDFFFGLGMPLFNFYAPLTYYLGELFHLLGAGYLDSVRLLAAVAMALSGIGAYLYARTLLSPLSSLFVAVVYMYAPYHLVNLYYRGDLPEYLAYTWFPFILWAMARLTQRKRFVYLFAGSVFYAALILTHNLSAFIFSGFLVIYGLAAVLRGQPVSIHTWRTDELCETEPGMTNTVAGPMPRDSSRGKARSFPQTPLAPRLGRWRDRLVDVLRPAVMALSAWALTAFFWLPALAEKSLVDFDRLLAHYDFHEHFPTLEQLLSTSLIHRYGVIFRGAEVYGYKLGLLQAVFLILGLALLLWRRRRCPRGLPIEAAASLLVAAVALFLIFPASSWVWERVPLLSLTQFPWRFLAFIALPGALLAGLVVELLPRRLCWPSLALFVPLVIASSVAGLSPMLSNVQEADISPRGSIAFELTYGPIGTSAAAEYLPKWVRERPATSPFALAALLDEPVGPIAGHTAPGMAAVQVERRTTEATYRVRAEKASAFIPNLLYFPGWEAFVDGDKAAIAIADPSGLIQIDLPPGEHTINLRFAETPLRQASDIASALALFILLALLMASLRDYLRRPLPSVKRVAVSRWLVLPPFLRRSFLCHSERSGAGRRISSPELDAPKRSFPPPPPPASPPCSAQDDVFESAADNNPSSLRSRRSLRWTYPTIILAGLVTAWLLARSAYDAAYARPTSHPFPLVMNFADEVFVEGYDLAGLQVAPGLAGRVLPGESFPVTIFWRALGAGSAQRYKPFARLTNASHQTWAYAESPAAYPAASVPRDATVATTLALVVPAGTPPGAYQVEIGFQSTAPPRLLAVRRVQLAPLLPGDKGAPIGPFVVGRRVAAGGAIEAGRGAACCAPPGPLLAEPVNFGDKLSLLDLSLADGEALRSGRPGAPLPRHPASPASQARAGEVVHLDLLWRAIGPTDGDWTVTVRLAGADRTLWAVHDSRPASGAYPTSFWQVGEMVRDQIDLAIPPETPPGQYDLLLEVVSRAGPLSILDRNRTPVGPTFHVGAVALAPAAEPADARQVRVPRRLNVPLVAGLTVLGYGLGRPELRPGEPLRVEVVWQPTKDIGRDLAVRLALLDKTGKVWATHSGRPVGDAYPTSAWRAGEVLRGQYSFTLPAAMPEGEADVAITLLDVAGGEPLARLDLDRVRILPRTRSFTAAPAWPLSKLFDGKIRLLGFDAAVGARQLGAALPVVAPAETLALTVHWQAVTEMSTSYTVFAQVLDAAGRLVAQHDAPPRDGQAPTTGWLPGEVVADEHKIALPADLPEGDYTVIAGLYDALTGKRLPVAGGADFVVLMHIRLTADASR